MTANRSHDHRTLTLTEAGNPWPPVGVPETPDLGLARADCRACRIGSISSCLGGVASLCRNPRRHFIDTEAFLDARPTGVPVTCYGAVSYKPERGFEPLTCSLRGNLQRDLVFLGYQLTCPERPGGAIASSEGRSFSTMFLQSVTVKATSLVTGVLPRKVGGGGCAIPLILPATVG